jgi:hypothetical protein
VSGRGFGGRFPAVRRDSRRGVRRDRGVGLYMCDLRFRRDRRLRRDSEGVSVSSSAREGLLYVYVRNGSVVHI